MLAQYLEKLERVGLARKWVGGQQLALDQAYDLTLAKFRNLPSIQQSSLPLETSSGGQSKGNGLDYRHYFKAFLRRPDASLDQRADVLHHSHLRI